MSAMDALLESVQQVDPLWSVVLVAIALALLLGVKLWRASFGRILAGLVALAIIASVAAGSYYGYQHLVDTRRLAERRALDERAIALFQQTIQPGSTLACLDGSPVPAVLDACERNLFAEPPHVAAAVAIVTQRIGFLTDALQFAQQRDPDYLERIEAMRKSVEGDPYGFVAFVLSVEHGCTAQACRSFDLLRDPARVQENMRVRRLEAFLAKYATAWKNSGMEQAEASSASTTRTTQPEMSFTPSVSITDTPAAAADSAALQPPTAASAPLITPPVEAGFNEPARSASASPAPADSGPANSPAASAAPAVPAAPAAKNPLPRPASQPKAKAKASPAARRTNEPVAGLPRVVPGDYVREEPEEAAAAEAGQAGAPTPISPPQQNFTVQ